MRGSRGRLTLDPVAPEEATRHLEPLRTVTRLMDQAVRVPGSPIRFGLDALIGLLPGIGDVVGGVISTWFLVTGARLGAPPTVLARMGLNVAVDALLGAIPLLGDLFDVGWKANVRNLALLESHVSDPLATRRQSTWALGVTVVAVLLTLGSILVAALWVGGRVLGWVQTSI